MSWNLSTNFRFPCHAVLFCKRSNKQQRRCGIISNLTKGETFFISYNNELLLEVISRCSNPPWSLQKKQPLFQFGQEENMPGHSTEKGAHRCVLKTDRVFPIPTNKVERGWLTLLKWLTLPSYVRDSLRDKSMLAPSKKGLHSPFSLAKKRIYLPTYFRATRVFPIPRGRVRRGWLTLCL